MRADNLVCLVRDDVLRLRTRLGWLSLGVVVGVASLVFLLALLAGIQSIILKHILGVLPDEIDVVPSSIAVGPLQLQTSGQLDVSTLEKLRQVPGVVAVYRRARLQIPSELTARYSNYDFVTDIIIEGVDEGLLKDEFGDRFSVQPPGQPIPAVLPGAMIDLLNAGLNVHVGGPALSRTALVGTPFNLLVGRSSFHAGQADTYACQLIGISDRVTLSGPSIPYPYLEQWSARSGGPALTVYGAVLKLARPEALDGVASAVTTLGLRMPKQEQAVWVGRGAGIVQAALFLFAGVLLLVAGVGIVHGLGMMIEEERTDIGLMRALGARRADVLAIFMARAWLIGAAGALVGALIGCTLVWLVPMLVHRWLPTDLLGGDPLLRLTPANVLGPWLFGVVTSAAAGFVPARQAARLEPVDALRA